MQVSTSVKLIVTRDCCQNLCLEWRAHFKQQVLSSNHSEEVFFGVRVRGLPHSSCYLLRVIPSSRERNGWSSVAGIGGPLLLIVMQEELS